MPFTSDFPYNRSKSWYLHLLPSEMRIGNLQIGPEDLPELQLISRLKTLDPLKKMAAFLEGGITVDELPPLVKPYPFPGSTLNPPRILQPWAGNCNIIVHPTMYCMMHFFLTFLLLRNSWYFTVVRNRAKTNSKKECIYNIQEASATDKLIVREEQLGVSFCTFWNVFLNNIDF